MRIPEESSPSPPLFLPFSSRIGMTFANAEEFRAGMEFSKGKTEGRPSLYLSHRTRFKLGGFRRRVSSGSANSEKKRTHLLFARPGCSSLALSLHVGGIYLMMELPESCLKPLTRRGGEEKFLSFPSPLLPINNPSKVRRRRRRRRRPPFLSSHPSLKFPQTERKEENALLLLYRT